MEKRLKKLEKKLSDRVIITSGIEDELCSTKEYVASINKALSALEYKIWQFNTLNNQILYQLTLEGKKKREDFHPLVSIIIPVYNGSNYLSTAINCALNQTYDNIEILVINDGSSDNGKTANVAKKFDKKIRYYEKENGGVSSALNFGISKMHGDYFAWLSHDDEIDPTHIEKLVDHVSYVGNEFDIPFASFKIIDENSNLKLRDTIAVQIHCNDFKLSYLKNELSLLQGEINGGSVLIPKDAFKKYGYFDESAKITQERDMWSRLIKTYHFVNIPYDTASIRSHSNQVTNTKPDIAKKTNAKNLEIIQSLDEQTVVRLYGSKSAFYENLKRFYSDNSNDFMVSEIEKIAQKNETE